MAFGMDDFQSKERRKRLILLGKERGFLTRAAVADLIQADLSFQPPPPRVSYPRTIRVDAKLVDSVVETLNDMGTEVRD